MRRVAVAMLLALALAACGDRGMTLRSDKDLTPKVGQVMDDGGTVPLASLTDFEWDTVYCYMQGAEAEEINREVGHTVIEPGRTYGDSHTLAVFLKDGKLVKAVLLPELNLDNGRQPDGVLLDRNRLRAPA